MKKLLTVGLSAIMVLSMLCACGSGGEKSEKSPIELPAGGLKLTELASVTKDVSFTTGGILTVRDAEGIRFVARNGEIAPSNYYEDIDSYVATGVCVVSKAETDGTEFYGIVDTNRGKELIPCEASSVRLLNDRFVLLGYKTGEGTKDENYDFAFKNGEIYYFDGYGLILDLQTGKTVENVKVEDSFINAHAFGECLYVDDQVFDASGKNLGTYESLNPITNSNIAIEYTRDGIVIYDGSMNKVGQIDSTEYRRYETYDGVSTMLSYYDSEISRYQLVDMTGKPVIEPVSRIQDIYLDKYVVARTTGEKYGLLDLNGNEIIPAEYETIRYIEPGYFACQKEDSDYYLFDTDGTAICESPLKLRNGCVFVDAADETKFLILETGEFYSCNGYVDVLGLSLVEEENQIIDAISGEIIMKDFVNCLFTGDCLYILEKAEDTSYKRVQVAYAD